MDELRLIKGPYGTAQELPMPDAPGMESTLQHWLITAPNYHPMWDQYTMALLRLCDLPGIKPAHKNFPEATHEILIVALDPRAGKQTPETMLSYALPGEAHGKLPFLLPINIEAQCEATDAEMLAASEGFIRAITDNGITPETSDAPAAVRHAWDQLLAEALRRVRAGRTDWS